MLSLSKKNALTLCCIALLNLSGGIVYAQVIDSQSTGVTIMGALNTLDVPSTLNIDRVFMNQTGQTLIYQPFDPSDRANKVIAYDTRNDGGFTVDLQVTNFVSGSNIIPYNNISVVTLAESTNSLDIDTALSNIPAGNDSGTVTAPLDCNWDGTGSFSTYCETPNIPELGFSNPVAVFTGTDVTSDPKLIIDGRSPSGVGRIGQYGVSLGLKLAIDQGTPPGNYESFFTFSLNPA